jgi:hypothetical protein
VNVAYFRAVPKDVQGIAQAENMTIVFFSQVLGDKVAKRVMSASVAFSIFGNILVMTSTAARIKQEIAKEGILTFSLFFATSHATPISWWWSRGRPQKEAKDHLEQTPMAALGLHGITSIILIGATSMLDPSTSYEVLFSLYAIHVRIGFFVAGGLLYLKFQSSKNWSSYTNLSPSFDLLPGFVFWATCAFLLITTFIKPSGASPYAYGASHIQWFIVPTIGLSSLTWGILWFLGLHFVMWIRGKLLIVTRIPFIVRVETSEDQWVQESELVDHEWHAKMSSEEHSLYKIERG